ncbi:MAG: type II secretion system F family protein [Armatimonadetes bacterium]|nr:type II secretion system F family protein [Armatimonadota bacterium]
MAALSGRWFRPRIGGRELSVFFRSLHTLIQAGIPLVQSLTILRGGEWSPAFSEALTRLELELTAGHDLSQSLAHTGAVPADLVGTLRSGEQSGKLLATLSQVCLALEKSEARRRRLVAGLVYPFFLAGVSAAMLAALFFFFVPQMLRVLESLQLKPSFPLNLLSVALDPVLLTLVAEVVLLIAAIVVFWIRTPEGQLWRDEVLLEIPLVGRTLLAAELSRFAFNVALMTRAGLTLTEALLLQEEATLNRVLAQEVARVRTRLEYGMSLGASLAEEAHFDRLLVSLVESGEAVGRLPKLLDHASRLYEEAFETTLERATAMLEPIILCTMGVLVGGIQAALLLPLARIVQAVS